MRYLLDTNVVSELVMPTPAETVVAWVRAQSSLDLPRQFLGRLIPVDDVIAVAWGRLAADGRMVGRPLPVVDGLLLATAEASGLTLVTRNVADCAGRGVPVFDPWTGLAHDRV